MVATKPRCDLVGKMANRARGWRRIGIVLSVIWFVGFGSYLWSGDVSRIGEFYSWQLKNCYARETIRNEALQYAKDERDREKWSAETEAKAKECRAKASAFHSYQWEQARGGLWILFAVDLATILLGSLVVWLIVLVARWINRGFASV